MRLLAALASAVRDGLDKAEFDAVHILALLGVVALLAIAERVLDFVSFHCRRPSRPSLLKSYRRRGPKPAYALVTGASAGIGYGVALALVKLGFGVIITSHDQDELALAAAALRDALVLPDDATAHAGTETGRDEYVKTIVMDSQTATPDEMEAKLRATVVDPGLRVSILVNNVGALPVAAPPLRQLATYSPADVDGVIDVNARFMARLTTLMLPVLTHRGAGVDARGMSFGTHRRSLVINTSSGGMIGLPFLVMYSAVKAFNWSFSRALAREMQADPETQHIDVLCVVPGDVRSKGNFVGVAQGSPDAETFGQCIVDRADMAIGRGWLEMRPYWKHHLQAILIDILPRRWVDKGLVDKMQAKKTAFGNAFKKDA